MGLFWKRKAEAGEVDFNHLPRHLAIIMDGNGRWAKRRGLPRTAGHARGAETFRTIATYCKDIGIEYLTVYAFSTENWKRPEEEVSAIMDLLEKYLYEALSRMEKDRVRMRFFGDDSPLPLKLRELIARTNEVSRRYEGCQVNVCLNYGSRDEILRAARGCAEALVKGEISFIDEEIFSRGLWSKDIPDPELLIRPGGEKRLSNFLLWQAAYSELYFTDRLWPDVTTRDIDAAIAWYQKRNRRYGGI